MNKGLSVYPDINDQDFYKKISIKKEFYDNRINNISSTNCLQPHQIFLSNFLNPLTQYHSILINEMTGLGKTLAAISIAENFKKDYKILVLVKNKLLENNFKNELLTKCSNYVYKENIKVSPSNKQLDKELYFRKEINKYYSFVTPHIFNNIKYSNMDNTVIIIDEVHNIIGSDTYVKLLQLLQKSKNVKLVLLSATPNYDNILGIFDLSNLLNFKNLFPSKKYLVDNKLIYNKYSDDFLFLNETVIFLTDKGKKQLKDSLLGKVSFLITDPSNFPSSNFIGSPITSENGSLNVVKCIMSKFQTDIYNKTTLKTNTKNFLFKKSSDASTIVYPDSSYGKGGFENNIFSKKRKNMNKSFLKKENIKTFSCKLFSLLENLEKSDGLCFIYSNFVTSGGIELVKYLLKENGYTRQNGKNIVVINDIKNNNSLIRTLKIFNSEENKNGDIIKILLGGPLVSEGLTFKNIRQIHILDPHWNMSRIDQIIGRGIRFKSHIMLPPNKQNVDIFMYAAIPSSLEHFSIDLLKYKLSEKKDRAIKDVEHLIKSIAVDCYLNKTRNKQNSSKDYSRACQYTNCDYTCPWEHKGSAIKVDKTTYILEKHAKNIYKYIESKIRELYAHGYIYDLEYIVNYVTDKGKLKEIDKHDIYLVISDLLNTEIFPEHNLIFVGGYYVSSPKGVKVKTELFYKLFRNTDINKKINIGTTSFTKNKIKSTVIKPGILKNSITNNDIYGSIIDKTFRIVDNRIKNVSSAKDVDKRKINRGKICVFYTKKELNNIIKYLTGKTSALSKIESCDIIYQFLVSKKMLVF
jgi:superfamily II DNA or RNA helicase